MHKTEIKITIICFIKTYRQISSRNLSAFACDKEKETIRFTEFFYVSHFHFYKIHMQDAYIMCVLILFVFLPSILKICVQ